MFFDPVFAESNGLPALVGRREEPDQEDDDQGNDQSTDQSLEAVDGARGEASRGVNVLHSGGAQGVEEEPEDDREDDEPQNVATGRRAVRVAAAAAHGDELDGLFDSDDGRGTSASEGVEASTSVSSRHWRIGFVQAGKNL